MNIGHLKKLGISGLFVVLLCILFSGRSFPAQAASLHISPIYDSSCPTNSLEIKLSLSSSSEITMLKYDYAHVAKSRYFLNKNNNGFTINKNEYGEYVFHVTQNGYVSIFAMNAAGEEDLLVLNIKNIDTVLPELSISSKEYGSTRLVSLKATDDISSIVKIRYVEGAYASPSDKVWDSAKTFYNQTTLPLADGKYTFIATDAAGNNHIVIQRFGESKETSDEFRAVWIAYLDFKTTGYTKKEFKNHIEIMFNEACAMNMNAVVVHVRPFGDAMYDSDYFPWSRYVSGKQGKNPGFDPLKIMVEEAHRRGLDWSSMHG